MEFDKFIKITSKKNPWNKKSLDLDQDSWRNQEVKNHEEFFNAKREKTKI